MPKFHTVVGRREFMKALGLSGVALGTVAASAPVFHDLDDIIANPSASFKRPWWVREREFGDPTIEVDWSLITRQDNTKVMVGGGFGPVVGAELQAKLKAETNALQLADVKNNTPGATLRDWALYSACGSFVDQSVMNYVQPIASWAPGTAPQVFSWTSVPGPEYFGATKWQGTPEENSKMLRAAMRFMGASQVQFGELGEHERKLIFTKHNRTKKEIVFENVEKAYETTTKHALPDKPLWIVSVAIQMSKELFRQGRSPLRTAANGSRYYQWKGVQARTQAFLNVLGYQGIGYPEFSTGVISAQADAILCGFSEGARNNNVSISPEFGTVVGYFSLLTDLPLSPSRPIDAGFFRFCHTCRKCATECPTQAISHDSEPSWDIPRSSLAPDKEVTWTMPGKKVFHTDFPLCFTQFGQHPGCGVCMGTCTFNVNGASAIHEMVKATLSTTSLFNGFMWKADDAFGYGIIDEGDRELWWDYELPTYGYSTALTSKHGGYNR